MPSQPHKLIELSHVAMCYDRRDVLDDVDLEVHRGDFVAVTGPNGGGKTTLLRIMLKLLKPTRGLVTYYDASGDVTRHLPIGYLPQKNMIDSRFPITVDEVVASGLLAKGGITPDEKRSRVDDMISLMGLQDMRRSVIGTLSGGQLQRALLGRALISDPEVVVLDEPLSYIDKRFEHKLYSIVADIAARATVVLVSHEMSIIAGMATRHIIVDRTVHECCASRHYVPVSPCDCDDSFMA